MLIKYQIQFTYFPAVCVRILHKLPLSDLFSFVCNINYQQYDFEWNLFFCLYTDGNVISPSQRVHNLLLRNIQKLRIFFSSKFFFYQISNFFFLNFSNYRIYVCIHIYNNILVSLRINSCCKCWTFQINYFAMKLACCENIQLKTISKTLKEILQDFQNVSDIHV